MVKQNTIKVFEEKKVRTVWDSDKKEWYFSIVDVVEVLTENPNPRNYWKELKHRLVKEGNESVASCNKLKIKFFFRKNCVSKVNILFLADTV